MFDLVITNGHAVLPGGAATVDIAVSGHAIVAIGGPGSLAAVGATRVVDATGQIVIPGGIDPHIHCALSLPGPAGRMVDGEKPNVVSKALPVRRHHDDVRLRVLEAGRDAARRGEKPP